MAAGVKVCQVISSFHPRVGGAEQATLHLCEELSALGARPIVFTRMYPGLTRRDHVKGIPVWRLGLPAESKLGAPFFILHVLWMLAVRFRDVGVVHAQGTDAQLLSGLLARILLGRRLVMTIHSEPVLRLRIRGQGGGLRFRAVKKFVDVIGVLSTPMATTLIEHGAPREKIVELSNGVDVQRFRPATAEERRSLRAEHGIGASDLVAVFVGRLVALKRVDLLLGAWEASGLSGEGLLLIAGDGPERTGLETQAQPMGDSVRFLGRHGQPEQILRMADVYVLPSQREGQSVALLEAMACGVVPVVSDLEPNLCIVTEGVTGFSFKVDDQASLEEALLRGVQSDRSAIGGAAAAQVQARNSLQATAKTHLDCYMQLAGA